MARAHKPSDYAHAFGEPVPPHGKGRPAPAPATDAGTPGMEPDAEAQTVRPGMELATFRLLYESDRICLFETRDGHLTAVDVKRLA